MLGEIERRRPKCYKNYTQLSALRWFCEQWIPAQKGTALIWHDTVSGRYVLEICGGLRHCWMEVYILGLVGLGANRESCERYFAKLNSSKREIKLLKKMLVCEWYILKFCLFQEIEKAFFPCIQIVLFRIPWVFLYKHSEGKKAWFCAFSNCHN